MKRPNNPEATPRRIGTFLRKELAFYPGRLEDSLRITILTLLVVVIEETFQVPLVAYSAYIVYFASKDEKTSSVTTGLVLITCATTAIILGILVYTIAIGEPGLRIPLMALISFVSLFFFRTSPLGGAAFATGFVATMSLTLLDIATATSALPVDEVLTQTVLWLWVVAGLPLGLIVLANLVTGRDPESLFRRELSSRFVAAGRGFLTVFPESGIADTIDALLRGGLGTLLRHLQATTRLHGLDAREIANRRELALRSRELLSLAREWLASDVPPGPEAVAAAAACGDALIRIASTLSGDSRRPPVFDLPAGPDLPWTEAPREALILERATRILAAISRLPEAPPPSTPQPREPAAARHRLLADDAWSNPEYVRFALKGTLCILSAYVVYDMLAWPGIRSAMITCFFVLVGSTGETFQKMALRITGALIGGALGMATLLFLMPHMTSIGEFSLAIGAVAFVSAWISVGSEKLSYAGMQIAMAYFFCVIVGYGPSIDLNYPRDRVIGILLGSGIVFVVFTGIWPVGADLRAWTALNASLKRLAEICLVPETEASPAGTPTDAECGFDDALSRAWRFSSFEIFEPRPSRKGQPPDTDSVENTEALFGAILILFPEAAPTPPPTVAFRNALSVWLKRLADGIPPRQENAADFFPSDDLPRLEGIGSAARAYWQRELRKRAETLLSSLRDTPVSAPQSRP